MYILKYADTEGNMHELLCTHAAIVKFIDKILPIMKNGTGFAVIKKKLNTINDVEAIGGMD